jgi:hypothetical protein
MSQSMFLRTQHMLKSRAVVPPLWYQAGMWFM